MRDVANRPRDAAEHSTPGRSREFRDYMADLKISDPKRHAEISKAERAQVPEIERKLWLEEQELEVQMEGWTDETAARGVDRAGRS